MCLSFFPSFSNACQFLNQVQDRLAVITFFESFSCWYFIDRSKLKTPTLFYYAILFMCTSLKLRERFVARKMLIHFFYFFESTDKFLYKHATISNCEMWGNQTSLLDNPTRTKVKGIRDVWKGKWNLCNIYFAWILISSGIQSLL